jgi:adenylate cyclase
MTEFFAELKRRHIYRVGAAYVVVAWAVAQVIDLLSQVFALPAWIAQPTLVLLAIGFPIALIVAWTVATKPHEAVAATMRSKNTTVDWALFGAVAVLIALTVYEHIAGSANRAALQDGVQDALKAGSSTGGVSLAVLPFANLSSDPEQEFFSDGMTEEITAALARVPDLRVVGRTSAFQFKGQNQDLRAIGKALSATHLIEGSVRKAGDRLRITVQLIKTDDGTHIWSQNYDRQLTDVFAIQEDIARTITASLNMSLGLGPGENLVKNRNIDPESYQSFLQAKALRTARGIANLTDAEAIFEQVIARNRSYAPAWV